jgi:hypothetical protein
MGRLPTAARAPETRSRGGEDALLLAATARAGTRSDQFLADLCDVLEDPDQGQYRRNRRIWALGRLHDSRAVIPLVRLVRDGTEDAALRSRAARALADLAGPAAPAALARLTEDYGFGFAPAGIRGLLSLLVSP